MEFKYANGHEAIRFSVGGISGAPAIGGYLFRFSMKYALRPWNSSWSGPMPTFRGIVAPIDIGEPRRRLGLAFPESQLILTADEYLHEAALFFELTLSTQQVEHLERIRAGGPLEFIVGVHGERTSDAQHERQFAEVRYRASQEEWIRVLKDLKYGHFLLCEIPISMGTDDRYKSAWAALKVAGERIYVGDYNGAVSQCRTALEAVPPGEDLANRISAAAKQRATNPKSMSKSERLLNLLDATRHVAQLSVHVDGQNDLVEYTRDEALLILGTTASAIRDLARRDEGGQAG